MSEVFSSETCMVGRLCFSSFHWWWPNWSVKEKQQQRKKKAFPRKVWECYFRSLTSRNLMLLWNSAVLPEALRPPDNPLWNRWLSKLPYIWIIHVSEKEKKKKRQVTAEMAALFLVTNQWSDVGCKLTVEGQYCAIGLLIARDTTFKRVVFFSSIGFERINLLLNSASDRF